MRAKEQMMDSSKKTAVQSGILLICGIVFGILSSVPALEYPDYLVKLSSIRTQVSAAIFFQAAMATVYVGIAVLFYPVIKNYNKQLALAYFGFRIIGAAFLFAGIASLSLLSILSGDFVSAGHPDSTYFQTLGELLRKGRDLLNHIGMILPWATGGLILSLCMFKTRLVPRWLSLWGMVGITLTLASTLLLMLGFIKMATPLYFAMNLPAAFFELFLAAYLIVKGFNPLAFKAEEKAGL